MGGDINRVYVFSEFQVYKLEIIKRFVTENIFLPSYFLYCSYT
jgi:hypothetical protein